jgi:hypothetical protein
MEYVWVADSSELAPGQTKRVQVDGCEILLVNEEGAFYARVCPAGEDGVNSKTKLDVLVDGSQLYVGLPDPPN